MTVTFTDWKLKDCPDKKSYLSLKFPYFHPLSQWHHRWMGCSHYTWTCFSLGNQVWGKKIIFFKLNLQMIHYYQHLNIDSGVSLIQMGRLDHK